MKTLVLVIVSLVAGACASYFVLKTEVREANLAAHAALSSVQELIAERENAKAVQDLEQSAEIIGFVLAQKKRVDAPSDFVGEELAGMLRQRISAVEGRLDSISDEALEKKAAFQLDEARELVNDVEFTY